MDIIERWHLLTKVCFEERFVLHVIMRGNNIARITADTSMFSFFFNFSDKVQSDDEKRCDVFAEYYVRVYYFLWLIVADVTLSQNRRMCNPA